MWCIEKNAPKIIVNSSHRNLLIMDMDWILQTPMKNQKACHILLNTHENDNYFFKTHVHFD